MKRAFYLTPVVLLCALVVSGPPGCSSQQLAQAQTDLSTLQSQLQTVQQTAAAAQTQLDTIGQQIEAQQAVAATQPSNADAQKALSDLLAAQQKFQSILDQANKVLPQIVAGIQQAQNVIAAVQNGKAPDTSPLAAFGPYGELAGLLVTAGWALYQQVQNSKKTGQLDTLVKATGTDSQEAALAAAHQAIAAVSSPTAQAGPPAPAPAPAPKS